jgi:hypothetical protein
MVADAFGGRAGRHPWLDFLPDMAVDDFGVDDGEDGAVFAAIASGSGDDA